MLLGQVPIKHRDKRTSEDGSDQTRLLFNAMFVFDRVQVDPIEGHEQAPLGPRCEPLTGDSQHASAGTDAVIRRVAAVQHVALGALVVGREAFGCRSSAPGMGMWNVNGRS